MPHIDLKNINSAKTAFDVVQPFAQKIDGGIVKVVDTFINASKQSVLIEALAIEGS